MMTNLALNKRIEEPMRNPEAATDGIVTGYTGYLGFAEFNWPGTLTIDLGSEAKVQCIRFLLWDGLGSGGRRANRSYKYRLLASRDRDSWQVLYDNSAEGANGWQEFMLAVPMPFRYVRIHGLWNSENNAMHVVELEVHDVPPPPLGVEVTVRRTVGRQNGSGEIGDGLPIAGRLRDLLRDIDDLVESSSILNPTPFKDLTSRLQRQVVDVAALEHSVDAIRREIVEPVQHELALTNKMGRYSLWGFIVGIAGGIVGVASIIQNLLQ